MNSHSNDARAAILGRLRQAAGAGNVQERRQAVLDGLAQARSGAPLPVSDDLAERFCQRAQQLNSSVERSTGRDAVVPAVARYLAAHGLGAQAVCSPELAALDWAASGLAVAARPAQGDDAVGITGAFCAIAETGTLMLLSGPQTPASVSLLPETHIALVDAARIVPTMEDAFALLRAERGGLPRSVNFVSGPSRTGDIEQTLVLGAHGPCRVHLIVIG